MLQLQIRFLLSNTQDIAYLNEYIIYIYDDYH